MSTNFKNNEGFTEEEMLKKAIEGEADWLAGAEFDDISIEEVLFCEAIEGYQEILDTTEFDEI